MKKMKRAIVKLMWQCIPKSDKDYILSTLDAHDQLGIKKILNNRARFPDVFEKKKLILIHVPKVAGTSLAEALLDGKGVGHYPLKYFEFLKGSEELNNYFKVGFVRNPWSRLLSSYNYLLNGGAGRRDAKWTKLVNKYDSFENFVEGWVNEENIYKQIHFVPQRYFLEDSQGFIDLDYLGRYEALQQDFIRITEKIGVSTTLPEANKGISVSYQEQYTNAMREQVEQVYKQDIETFGYKFE